RGQDVDVELHDVVQLAAADEQERLQVLAHLAELGDQVALADDLAVLVEGHLPGEVERLAAPYLPAMGVAGGLGQSRGIHSGHVLGHHASPCRRLTYATTSV